MDSLLGAVSGAARSLGTMTLATGLILLAAYILDRGLERRVSASVRMWLYLPVALRLALPADFSTGLGLLGGRGSSAGEVTFGMPTVVASAGATGATSAAALWMAALAVYLAVAVGLLARWWGASQSLRGQLRSACPISPPAGPTGAPLAARICQHPTLGPAVIGLVRPRIVLPERLVSAGDTQAIELVLRHEMAHVRRGDHLLAAILRTVCVLLWPLLPVWLASWRLRILMECACDERATHGEKASVVRRYGELMLAMAEGHRRPGGSAQPVPAFGSLVAGRLRALGRRRRWPLALQALPVVAGGALALACSGASEEPAPPALSSAESPPPTAAPTMDQSPLRHGDTPAATVRGSLDKEVIRRVIAANIEIVKACYEQGLVDRPTLRGRVTVQFTIGPKGDVDASMLQSSTLAEPRVESCIVKEVRRWKFPPPEGGGVVIVSYPFELSPSKAAWRPPTADGHRWSSKSPDKLYGRRGPPGMAPPPTLAEPAGEREVMQALERLDVGPLRSCYDSILKRNPALAGRLEISLTVAPTGKIQEVRFTGPVDSKFSFCLHNAFVGRQLDVRPATPMEVKFPLVTEPPC